MLCLLVWGALVAVRAPTREALLHTLDTLHDVAHTMGLRFNKDKTEVCHWAKDYDLTPITWRHQLIPVRPPIMTYLGHMSSTNTYSRAPGHRSMVSRNSMS